MGEGRHRDALLVVGLRNCQIFGGPGETIQEVMDDHLDALKASQGAHFSTQ